MKLALQNQPGLTKAPVAIDFPDAAPVGVAPSNGGREAHYQSHQDAILGTS